MRNFFTKLNCLLIGLTIGVWTQVYINTYIGGDACSKSIQAK